MLRAFIVASKRISSALKILKVVDSVLGYLWKRGVGGRLGLETGWSGKAGKRLQSSCCGCQGVLGVHIRFEYLRCQHSNLENLQPTPQPQIFILGTPCKLTSDSEIV